MKRKQRGFPGQTPQQRAAHDDFRRVHDAARRKLNNVLHLWKFCTRAKCQRTGGCQGNSHACFQIFWPRVPEDIKNEIRAMICEAAGREDEAQTYRRAAQEMQDDPPAPARDASSPAEPAGSPRDPHMPRIRVL